MSKEPLYHANIQLLTIQSSVTIANKMRYLLLAADLSMSLSVPEIVLSICSPVLDDSIRDNVLCKSLISEKQMWKEISCMERLTPTQKFIDTQVLS